VHLRRVQEDLLGKFDLGLRDLGALSLKNIARQVRAWAWSSAPPGAAAGPLATVGAGREVRPEDRVLSGAGWRPAWLMRPLPGSALVKAGGSWPIWSMTGKPGETFSARLPAIARHPLRCARHRTVRLDVEEFSFEAWVNDLESVVDAIGLVAFP